MNDDEVISVKDWIAEYSKSKGTHLGRKRVMELYALANGKEKTQAEEVVDEIRAGTLNVYESARRFVQKMIDDKFTSNTISQCRSWIKPMLDSCVGEDFYKKTVFDRKVPNVKAVVEKDKAIPELDEVKCMVKLSTPQTKALIGGLLSGIRIGELVSRKWSDLEIREDGHAAVKPRAIETTAKVKRWVYFTSETVTWLKQYRLTLPSDKGSLNHNKTNGEEVTDDAWLFPGERGHAKECTSRGAKGKPECQCPVKHLDEATAYVAIKKLFKFAGMKDKEDEVYTLHSFRTVADSAMRRAGMPEKYVELIISHKNKLGASEDYKHWKQIEEMWVERVQPQLRMEAPVELIDKQDERIKALEARLQRAEDRLTQRGFTAEERSKILASEISRDAIKAINDWAKKGSPPLPELDDAGKRETDVGQQK